MMEITCEEAVKSIKIMMEASIQRPEKPILIDELEHSKNKKQKKSQSLTAIRKRNG